MKVKAPIIIKTPRESEIKKTLHGVYCELGCSYDHTREEYDAAFNDCQSALEGLRDRGFNRDGQWTGTVWDSGGWHWRLVSGGPFGWQLNQRNSGKWYCTNYHGIDLPMQLRSDFYDLPEDAIRDVILQMNQEIKRIEAQRKHLTDGLL